MIPVCITLFLIFSFLVFPVTADQESSYSAEQDPRIIWSAQLPDDPTNHPVVVDDTVYVTYSDITFHRPTVNGLNAYFTGNGTKKWNYSINEDPNAYFETPVTVADHVAYIGGWDGSVHAVNADTGNRIWRFRTTAANHTTNYTVQSAPAIYNNLVIFGSDDGYIYAVTARGGRLQWKTDLTHDMNVSVRGSPLIANGIVYIGGDDRVVHALDATTGDRKWQFNAGDRVRATMAVSEEGDILYFTAGDTLCAVSPATHQQKWVFRQQGQRLSSPVVSGNRVYITSSDDQVIAVDATSGSHAWSTTVARASVQPPVISNGILFASSKSDGANIGTITMVDAGSGTLNGHFTAPGSFTYPVAVKDGIAYAFAACPDPTDRKNYRDYTRLYAFSIYRPPVMGWQKSFGGSRIDIGDFIAKTPDGGTIVAGTTASGDGDIAHSGFHGVMDVFLSRFDKDHNVVWTRSYGGYNGMSFARHVLIMDDGYLVAGESFASNGDITGHHGTNCTSDIWLFKTDPDGNLKWSKSYGGSGSEAPLWSELTSDKTAILLTGFTYSTDGAFSGLRFDPATTDAFVMKINPNGDILWTKVFGGSRNDQGNQIEESIDGTRFYVVGTTWSNDGNVLNQNHGGNTGTSDGWVFAVDSDGEMLSSRAFGGSLNEMFQGMDIADDGRILVVGNTESNDGQIPVQMKHGKPGRDDIWFLALDQDGQILLNKCYGGTLDDAGKSIRDDASGNYYIQGSTSSNDGDVSFNHGGSAGTTDLWLLKLNPQGSILWEKCFGGSSDDWGFRFGSQHLAQSESSGYIIGETMSDDGDVEGFHGEADAWIVQLKAAAGDFLW